jgi:hypothetical protein
MAPGSELEPDEEDEILPDLTEEEREERARMIAFLATGRATGVAASLGMTRGAFIEKLKRYRIPRPRRPEPPKE